VFYNPTVTIGVVLYHVDNIFEGNTLCQSWPNSLYEAENGCGSAFRTSWPQRLFRASAIVSSVSTDVDLIIACVGRSHPPVSRYVFCSTFFMNDHIGIDYSRFLLQRAWNASMMLQHSQ